MVTRTQVVDLKWNGTKLTDAETMLEWAKHMTWKGLHPVVELSRQVYQKGIRLRRAAMEAVEARSAIIQVRHFDRACVTRLRK